MFSTIFLLSVNKIFCIYTLSENKILCTDTLSVNKDFLYYLLENFKSNSCNHIIRSVLTIITLSKPTLYWRTTWSGATVTSTDRIQCHYHPSDELFEGKAKESIKEHYSDSQVANGRDY